MRSKEEAHDYRYFPDPDLPPLRLSTALIDEIRASLPELPDEKRKRFIEALGLSSYDAGVLVAEKENADFYEQTLAACQKDDPKAPKLIANWMTSELFGVLNRE